MPTIKSITDHNLFLNVYYIVYTQINIQGSDLCISSTANVIEYAIIIIIIIIPPGICLSFRHHRERFVVSDKKNNYFRILLSFAAAAVRMCWDRSEMIIFSFHFVRFRFLFYFFHVPNAIVKKRFLRRRLTCIFVIGTGII